MRGMSLFGRKLHGDDLEKIEGTLRIELLSDAVFAITMTLLILEVHVPVVDGTDARAVIEAIREVLPSLLTFAFSFLTLSVFWVNHHHFMHQLTHGDWALLWHNLHLLFWMTVLPFVTAFLGANPSAPLIASIYACVMAMGAFSFALMARHAFFHSDLIDGAIPMAERCKEYRRALIGAAAFAAAALLAHISMPLAWSPSRSCPSSTWRRG
jgi:uncharacterized membrane protein